MKSRERFTFQNVHLTPNVVPTTVCTAKYSKKGKTEVEKAITTKGQINQNPL